MPAFATLIAHHLGAVTTPQGVAAIACGTFVVSYLFGSISWSFIIGKLKGVDIRKEGSGNLGATNVTRVLGKPWGVFCFFLDFLKGLLPALAAGRVLAPALGLTGNTADGLLVAAAAGAFCGHLWSAFMGFKGGKGIATGGGALAAASPLAVIASLVLWFTVFKTSRYVSLASVIAASLLPVHAYLLSRIGVWPISPTLVAFFVVSCSLAVVKHHANIVRLINGTENRFEKK